ncbi:AMP-dependent synthetase [Sulfurifustis variabilis]|uniref:AMP-dependent synthetase n=1 Tax=Sulfurifustis variabilis TaxID=1675686 RepID=A0A1C7AFU6_9GAMM|nr:AMP-binding protein [Sulfurifustis variabilis]BAU50278.1 AMP-dependent synthetase [Sulfurifustis variabilis]
MNLAELLQAQARERPAAPAIIERGGTLTFAGLEHAAGQAAALLHADGVRAGDGVLVFQPMSGELYVILSALFRLGAVAVFLDPGMGRRHIEGCCAMYPPKAIIASWRAQLLIWSSPALRRIPRRYVCGRFFPGAVSLRRARRLSPLAHVTATSDATPALVTFTSGSTGTPKAALRTHGFLAVQHRVLARHLSLQAGEIDLATLPIFVLANLASGVTSLIPDADLRRPGAVDAVPVLAQVRRHRATRTAASPAFLERLVDHAERHGVSGLGGLRRVYTGGAPVFPALLRRLQEQAPDAVIEVVYGSTEAEPIAHGRWRSGECTGATSGPGRGLLAGRPVPEIGLRILPNRWGEPIGPFLEKEFDRVSLPHGAAGEIVVSGAHVLPGYLHGRGDEETKFDVDGRRWHRTGDAGYIDDEGRLWLLGRAGARIVDGKGEIYPFPVELAALEQPGVRRAALVSHRGRRVLVVEPSGIGTLHATELKKALAWSALDQVRGVPRIPLDKRHNAKVDYPALRSMLEKDPG